MNLLELQVLAVVSRIPNGNDAPSPEFGVEPDAAAATAPLEISDNGAPPAAADDCSVKQPV
jgi:hypothetical protein